MKKRCLSIVVLMCLLLSCVGFASCETKRETFSVQSFEFFDTVTTVMGCADSREDFDRVSNEIFSVLGEYHRLFDIYHSYEGIENLHTVNEKSATQPVKVDTRIADLLRYGKEVYALTDGQVNIAMGSVLSLWHDCRQAAQKDPEKAKLPDAGALADAREHTDIGMLLLDGQAEKVSFADPLLRLDVGAIAKGYAVEKIAQDMEKRGITGYLLNVGGNVRVIGAKADGSPWTVGVEHPEEGEEYLAYLDLTDEALVTSGSYQRYYTVNGENYHHIIDPETGMPAKGFRSVSVVCKSSADADALSTALFCMSLESGRALIESLPDTEALWLFSDGTRVVSSGFENFSVG